MSTEIEVYTKDAEKIFNWIECEYTFKCPFCQAAGDEWGGYEGCEAEVGDYCKKLKRNIEK